MFRWNDCLEGHVMLGLFLSSATFILLLLVTFSTPFIRGLYFLRANNTKYGAFGYCQTSTSGVGCVTTLGYDGTFEIVGWLTTTHILFGIGTVLALFCLLSLILSLLRLGKILRNPLFFRTTALLTALIGILAEIFALINWVQAKSRFTENGIEASYGAALWLGLTGAIAAALSVCIGGPAITAGYLYKADRRQAYNV